MGGELFVNRLTGGRAGKMMRPQNEHLRSSPERVAMAGLEAIRIKLALTSRPTTYSACAHQIGTRKRPPRRPPIY